MSVTYRLALTIHNDERDEAHRAVYSDKASLDVAGLFSIDDRKAFDTLATLLREALVPEGSTVVEREAISRSSIA